jgi:hypothetical protein
MTVSSFPHAAAYAIAEFLKSVPADDRESVYVQAIAMLAEQEQREAEDGLHTEPDERRSVRGGFLSTVLPQHPARKAHQRAPARCYIVDHANRLGCITTGFAITPRSTSDVRSTPNPMSADP